MLALRAGTGLADWGGGEWGEIRSRGASWYRRGPLLSLRAGTDASWYGVQPTYAEIGELHPPYGRSPRGAGSGWGIGVFGTIVRTLFDGSGIIARSVKT